MMTTNNKKTKKYISKGSASISLPVASSGRSVSQGAARKTAREKNILKKRGERKRKN